MTEQGTETERYAAAWRQLLERHAITMCALERELGERHALGVSEFEVLERMVEDGEPGQRVQQLAAEVYLSQSALSRVIGRLERDGLVVREMCPTDRRGIFVTLTDAGRERYAAARATQRNVLAATLGGQQGTPTKVDGGAPGWSSIRPQPMIATDGTQTQLNQGGCAPSGH